MCFNGKILDLVGESVEPGLGQGGLWQKACGFRQLIEVVPERCLCLGWGWPQPIVSGGDWPWQEAHP